METQLFFPFPQFDDDDDDKVERDKQSASFFDDANENMEDKEPDDNVSGEPLTGCCGEHDRSEAFESSFSEKFAYGLNRLHWSTLKVFF